MTETITELGPLPTVRALQLVAARRKATEAERERTEGLRDEFAEDGHMRVAGTLTHAMDAERYPLAYTARGRLWGRLVAIGAAALGTRRDTEAMNLLEALLKEFPTGDFVRN